MANTVYGINDPETNKAWAKKLNVESLKKTWIGKFIGKTENALIQEHTDLQKSAGDEVTVTLRALLKGKGVIGDAILKGKEERLSTFTDKLRINQLRHAADRGGRMSQQRVLFNLRQGCMDALSDWMAGRWDRWFFQVMGGADFVGEVDEFGEAYSADLEYTGLNPVTAPTSGKHFWSESGTSTDEGLDSTGDRMALSLIDDLVTEAKLASPMIRPIKHEGEDCYVMFLHTIQVRDLRKDATSVGNWVDIQKAAMQGGKVKDNPIFTGALGMYNNVILHESSRVAPGVHSTTKAAITNVRRAVLCGAQAGILAFGQGDSFDSWNWAEEEEDFGNQLGVAAGFIGGMKKSKFDSKDFGTLVLSTWAAK